MSEFWYVLQEEGKSDGIIVFYKIRKASDVIDIPLQMAKEGYTVLECLTKEQLQDMGVL